MKILISIGRGANPANYVNAVELAGGRPQACYLPKPDLEFDGLILAGGGDIEPALYGQKNHGSTDIDPDRDRAELELLEAFARAGKPVLGICRGHQLVNVWAGGDLIQDLGERNVIHRREDRDKVHDIIAEPGILQTLYGIRFRGNSAHHQAVGLLGNRLRITAWSADGVVEAMEYTELPILTTQFHPERMTGADTAEGSRIFQWFMQQFHKM